MRKAVLLLSFIAFACSGSSTNEQFEEVRKIEGELTRENVENLVRTGVKDKPLYSFVEIPSRITGTKRFEQNEALQKLISDSILQYKADGIGDYYMTLYKLDNNYDMWKEYKTARSGSYVATYKMAIDSLLSIQEIPYLNMVEVKVQIKKTNDGTPFRILDSITENTRIISLGLRHEVDGWVYDGNKNFHLANQKK